MGGSWYDTVPYFIGTAAEITAKRDTNASGCCDPSLTLTMANCPAGYDSNGLKNNVRNTELYKDSNGVGLEF
jgi:hypothetical protein